MFTLNIALSALLALALAEPDTIQSEKLKEVVVVSNNARQRVENVQAGAEQLKIKELTASPQLFGERDIMRSLQLLAGVKAESDASSGFQVRGGTSAQNQILLDVTPVYNAGHLGGLFSAFNDDALAAATLYKGLLPAQFGGISWAKRAINTSFMVVHLSGCLRLKPPSKVLSLRERLDFWLRPVARIWTDF